MSDTNMGVGQYYDTPEEKEIERLEQRLTAALAENTRLKEQVAFIDEGLPESIDLEDHYVWAVSELTRRRAHSKADIARIIGSLRAQVASLIAEQETLHAQITSMATIRLAERDRLTASVAALRAALEVGKLGIAQSLSRFEEEHATLQHGDIDSFAEVKSARNAYAALHKALATDNPGAELTAAVSKAHAALAAMIAVAVTGRDDDWEETTKAKAALASLQPFVPIP